MTVAQLRHQLDGLNKSMPVVLLVDSAAGITEWNEILEVRVGRPVDNHRDLTRPAIADMETVSVIIEGGFV